MEEVLEKVQIEKYPAYKNSGIDWVGEIPEHWLVKPGFTIIEERNEKNIGLKEKTVLSLSYGNVKIKPEEKLTGLVPESFETYQLVYPGDIIIRPTDLQNDKTSLRTGLAKDKGIITSAYINLKIKNNYSSKFYHYFFHAIDITKVIYGLGSGLRQSLSFNDFKRLKILFPPIEEQTRIAQFLDQKTAQIEKAISIKEKQIELLKERRQILIHNAVTRGLNPDAPLKDSGVDWIGEIPAHWEVMKLKQIFAEKKMKTNPSLNCGSISYGKVIVKADEKIPYSTKATYQEVLKGDFLINPLNLNYDLVSLRIALSYIDVVVSSGYIVINNIIDLNKEYYKYLLHRYDVAYMKLLGSGVRQTINFNHIANSLLLFPPISEQLEISKFLEAASLKIDKTISLKEKEIEKLKEYKATLINSAVTGKIKVS